MSMSAPASPNTTERYFPQLREDPFRPPAEYERWRDEAPVVRAALHSDQSAWIVVGYDAAVEALTSPHMSVDVSLPKYPRVRQGVSAKSNDMMLRAMDPPLHGVHRRLMAPQFTLKRVNELEPELTRVLTELIDDLIAKGGPVDLHKELSLTYPTKVICALIGVDYSLSDQIQKYSSKITTADATAEELAAANEGLFALLDEEVRKQYDNPRDGLIGTLIAASREGKLEHRQILGQTFITIVAGHETTAHTISMGCRQLIGNPEIYERVRNDLSLVPGMIEDMIRMHALPDGTASRVATADVVIGGQEIKAGEGLVVNLIAPNFDPTRWEKPYELNVDRNSRDHISFSTGIHSCLGQNLARAELRIAFEQLLTRLPTLRLADVENPFELSNNGYTFGVRRLVVDW